MQPDHIPNHKKADPPKKSGFQKSGVPRREITIAITGEFHRNVYGTITHEVSDEDFIEGIGTMFGARVRNMPKKEQRKAFLDFLRVAKFYAFRR